MKRSLTALVLAAALMGSLTACTTRDNGNDMAGSGSVQNSAGSGVQDSASGNVSGNANGGSAAGGPVGSGSVSGSAGSVSDPADGGVVAKGPAGSVYSNGRVNYSRQSTVGQRTNTGNWTANPYLTDGRYRASGNGVVGAPRGNADRSLTDAARDLVRGTGDALRDAGDGVKDAVRDVTGR